MTEPVLFKQFAQACGEFGSGPRAIEKTWAEIEQAYNSPARFYHNLTHLLSMFRALEEVASELKDFPALVFALFYHDVIYRPLSTDNESKSADLAALRLEELHIPDHIINKTLVLILSTRAHQVGKTNDENFFIDADLSILGARREEYQDYASNIRREYKIVPDMVYNPGRRKVLRYFLDMPAIFKSSYFQDKLEINARRNLEDELKMLGSTSGKAEY